MATVEERLAALEKQMTKVTDELGESYTLSKTGQQTDQILGDAILCTAQSLTTGQQAQARSNIAAASDGFGLGKSAYGLPSVNPSNIDACTAAGWYYYYDSAYGSLAGLSFSGGIFVVPSFTDTLQYFFPRGSSPNPGTYAVRKLAGDTWTEWDINNPPLTLGVEYRTTERYLGKPVYYQLLNCGSAPSQGASKAIDLPAGSTDQTLVQASMSYYGITFPKYDESGTVSMAVYCSPGTGKLFIYSPGDDRSANGTIYALIKYTKSTD